MGVDINEILMLDFGSDSHRFSEKSEPEIYIRLDRPHFPLERWELAGC